MEINNSENKKTKQSSMKSFMMTSSFNSLNNQSVESPVVSNSCDNIVPIKHCLSPNVDEPNKRFITSTITSKDQNKPINMYDIGHYINRSLKQHEIEEILKKIWKPDQNYKFPITEQNKKKLKFQYTWLHSFNWLSYSAKFDGVFCKFCVAFANNEAGINSQKLGALVKKPFCNWKHALETFKNHSTLQYHLKCLLDVDNFQNMKQNPTLTIENKLNTCHAKQVMENRRNIIPIIETIILCGQQNIAIRGHRDSGKFIFDDYDLDKIENDGNFRNLLRYRSCGDSSLKLFLESPSRIKYTSATSQNSIIDACNSVLLNKIVRKVNEAKCFTVLVDETADIAGTEQVSICVRYINDKNFTLHEDFLQFVPTTDMTGRGIASLILESLKGFGIDTQYLRGQGYDGAAAMSGRYNGVQHHIKQIHPLALYIHCSAHTLNLAVSSSCGVQSIRNCLGTVGKIRDFFIYPKRKHVLSQCIEKSESMVSKRTLKRNCETRWIERYHSINDFLELFESVVDALDEISEWLDTDSSSKAQTLKIAILQSEFIIALLILSKGFGFGLPLSKQFQKTNIDLKMAMNLAQDTLEEIESFRENADSEFHDIFLQATQIYEKFEIPLTLPRVSKFQRNRNNVQTNDIEQYFRITIFIPYIDSFINQLKSRFVDHKVIINGFHSLFDINATENDFMQLIDIYKEDLNSPTSILIGEFKLWQRKLNNLSKIPNNAIDALINCNIEIYPSIFKLLKILSTLPVSTSSNERTFSTMKRIKTYLRNTISEVK